MNLTLSLAINDGGGGGTTKKRKLLRDSDDDDHDPRVAAAETAPGDDGAGLRLMHLLLSSVAAAESGHR